MASKVARLRLQRARAKKAEANLARLRKLEATAHEELQQLHAHLDNADLGDQFMIRTCHQRIARLNKLLQSIRPALDAQRGEVRRENRKTDILDDHCRGFAAEVDRKREEVEMSEWTDQKAQASSAGSDKVDTS